MSESLVAAFTAIYEAISRNKQMLTDLDAVIGDADHGVNIARGFEAAQSKVQELAPGTGIDIVLKTIGMALISKVGGASGPLYGTAFLWAGKAAHGITDFNEQTAVPIFEAAIDGIRQRGKAVRGEKTMLDALEPALEAFIHGVKQEKSLKECLNLAAEAAEDGVEYTKTIIATKGRASYLGERSIGHQDPGATSSYIILKALADFSQGERQE
ncbi:MAG: dihydroxyacetone kinase, subunit [Firmicutes bacterium]|nr:dihydroxyacetone kinase, subunit [Bacillota bacterium]